VSQNLSQYGSLIDKTGIDKGTAASIMQGLGAPTAGKFFQAYINNPNMSTSDFLYQVSPNSASAIIANNGNLYGGQTLQGTVNRFATNLGAPASGTGGSSGGVSSPFDMSTGAANNGSLTDYGSPFANMGGIYTTPGSGSNPYTQSTQYTQSTPYGQQTLQQQQQSSNGGSGQQTSSGGTNTSTQTGSTGAAVSQIIVQPKTVVHGSVVTVAWSSAGMNAVTPCSVKEDTSTQLAQTNEGSVQVTVPTSGTVTFSLTCTPQSASGAVQKTASVIVQ
jgi:hypothetical protein